MGEGLRLRHRCRNLRCGTTLKEPQGNPHAAFCCRGCWERYHWRRCIVCEQEYIRGNDGEHWFCERRKCRREYRKFPAFYRPFHFGAMAKVGGEPKLHSEVVETRIKRALKPASRSLRAFCWKARDGSELTWELLRLGDLEGFDPTPAALVQRREGGWLLTWPRMLPEPPIEDFDRALRRGEQMMLWALPRRMPRQPPPPPSWMRSHAGEQFAARTDTIASDWRPIGDGEDMPDIPEFLRR